VRLGVQLPSCLSRSTGSHGQFDPRLDKR
jgi:hypothetical protein